MPKSTLPGGALVDISDCYIKIPVGAGEMTFTLNNLPDISDSKSAAYNDEPVIGRASPIKTYSHSENRVISMQIHLFVTHPEDVNDNLFMLRALESAVYPRDKFGSAPFIPPPICKIKCGHLLALTELCVILKSYSVKFPTNVAWDEVKFTPYNFDVDTSWEVVYKNIDLPGQQYILFTGR